MGHITPLVMALIRVVSIRAYIICLLLLYYEPKNSVLLVLRKNEIKQSQDAPVRL